MNCDAAREQLQLLALGEGPPEGGLALQRHLAGCPRCRAAANDYQMLVADIARLAPPVQRSAVEADTQTAVASAMHRERFSRRTRWAAAAAAMLLAAATVWVAASRPWEGQDPSAVTMPPVAPVASPMAGLIWEREGARSLPAAGEDAILMAGDSIYVLSDHPETGLAALEAASGDIRWRRAMRTIGCLSADERRVYCLATAGGRLELVALDAGDGRQLWTFPADAAWRVRQPQPALPDGDAVCWTADRTVYRLDANGRALWKRTIDEEGLVSAPVLQGDAVCVASSRALYRLDPRDGRVLSRRAFETRGNAYDRPQLASGDGWLAVARMVGREDEVLCLETAGDRVRWRRSAPAVSHLLAGQGRLFVRGTDVQALDLADGQTLWRVSADGCGPMTLLGGTLCFADGTGAGTLCAIDPSSGRPVWRHEGIQSCDALLGGDGVGYLKTRDGVIHAMALPGRW